MTNSPKTYSPTPNNPKTFWKLIKSCFGNKQSISIPPLIHNNNLIHEDSSKATLLNEYFISQSIPPNSNIPLPDFSYVTDARLGHINVTPTLVHKILSNLDVSKACGPDKINNKILKQCASSLCVPLSNLFNKSLSLGIFPSQWKLADVSAIFKKLNRQIKENYRPISLLSCISKVFERLVYNDFFDYLVTNKLLCEDNSGFKYGDSTIFRLTSLLHSIYQGLDSNKEVILVFLDISKAFD